MKYISKYKWWIVGVLGLLLALYLLIPTRDKNLSDIDELKREKSSLELTLKIKDDLIAEFDRLDKIQADKIDSLEAVQVVINSDNEILTKNNQILYKKYDQAVKDKDTVTIVSEAKELKEALVKSEDKFSRLVNVSVKIQRELKSQVKIKDSLLVAERSKNTLLMASNKALFDDNIGLAKDLNKSEKRRVRNARMGKVMTFVAAGLTALILIK